MSAKLKTTQETWYSCLDKVSRYILETVFINTEYVYVYIVQLV
jgi:hypothetical protein